MCNSTNKVTLGGQMFAMWVLDEKVPGSILDRTYFRNDHFQSSGQEF